MVMFYLVLAIMCFCASVSCVEHTDICHYFIDNKCLLKTVEYADIFDRHLRPCTTQDIPKDITYNVMEKNGTASHGVVDVEFQAPNLVCEFRMVLFINPDINNPQDCNKYTFDPKKNDTVIHSREKNLCLTDHSSSCRKNWLIFFYQYVYTGCYAIAFVVNEQYIFMKQEFLRTEYNKTEIRDAIYRCTYQPTAKSNGSSLELVSISTDVSLLAGPIGLKFEIVPASPLFEIESDTNGCNRDEHPIISHRFSMSVRNNFSVDQNCSMSTSIATGEDVKNVECKFTIDNAPANSGYCLVIRILDARCHRGTSWDPPKSEDMTFPCSWKQYCQQLERKQAAIEDVKKTYDEELEIPRIFYLVLIMVIVSVVVAVLCVVFILYRRRSRRALPNSLRNKIKNFDEDGSTILELNGSKSQEEKLVRESGIVLLYVKESEQLMELMADFRKVLEKHTGCDVYDWWASEFWNDVAYTGGYEWITNLIRKDYRVIWMDTQRSRLLAASPRKNGYDKLNPLKNVRNNHEAVDFRDNIYPTVVDFAKRTNQKLEQEYQRYFVVRLESFENADKAEDPFADLSPHVRYLIPCHLDKLCCQLSISEPYEDEMNIDKSRLRKYLSHESVVAFESTIH